VSGNTLAVQFAGKVYGGLSVGPMRGKEKSPFRTRLPWATMVQRHNDSTRLAAKALTIGRFISSPLESRKSFADAARDRAIPKMVQAQNLPTTILACVLPCGGFHPAVLSDPAGAGPLTFCTPRQYSRRTGGVVRQCLNPCIGLSMNSSSVTAVQLNSPDCAEILGPRGRRHQDGPGRSIPGGRLPGAAQSDPIPASAVRRGGAAGTPVRD
jgi:hypothetical protein